VSERSLIYGCTGEFGMRAFTIVFLLFVAPFAAAETYFAVGGGLNFVPAQEANPNYWLTANLRLQVREHFAVEPEIGFWSNTITQTSCFLSCSTQTVHLRDTQVGVNIYYTFKTGSINWATGAGPSVHFQDGKFGLLGASSEKDTRLGGQVLGGADVPLSQRTNLFLMLRADYVPSFDLQGKVYGGLRVRF
jgi:hypothetical protein